MLIVDVFKTLSTMFTQILASNKYFIDTCKIVLLIFFEFLLIFTINI